ncbi:MAG: flagellin A [Helicobacteraceae bacterium]|nr:flagellin A [Helicobacteraceae bacterium]
MAFQVNTNINALNAHVQSTFTQFGMKNSLEKLSSGLRINKAADDASGMTIADSLRSQASGLGQAIKNTNDAMGIIQIADKAMDEQIKILDTIKTKAIQAAQDGQTSESRSAIQSDIIRLIQGLDNIGNTTSFNGQALLSGQFTNKEFQVGAYSNQSIKASIGSTTSDKIGQIRLETGAMIKEAVEAKLTFKQVDGVKDVMIESVKISHSAGTGIGVLAEVINKSSDKTGIRATWNVITTSDKSIISGGLSKVSINGMLLGDILDIKANDSDGRLVTAINKVANQTGVEAYVDQEGRLNLRSIDGRGIRFSAEGPDNGDMSVETVNGGDDIEGDPLDPTDGSLNYGKLTLSRLDARDIVVASHDDPDDLYYEEIGFFEDKPEFTSQSVVNLRDVMGVFGANVRSAAGMNYNDLISQEARDMGAGVTTLKGAMLTIDIAESATKLLDKVRADLGSVQGQMISTVNNISVTQVNVKAAESQIREVDFAAESAEFSKLNILTQSGSYALSQANAVQQNILRLLN